MLGFVAFMFRIIGFVGFKVAKVLGFKVLQFLGLGQGLGFLGFRGFRV